MIYNSLSEISDNFDLFLFDAYGVFWEGNGFYENSRETMQNLINQGKTVVVISNSSALSADNMKKYERQGLHYGKEYNFLISSGDLLRKSLLEKSLKFSSCPNPKKYYVIGQPHIKAFSNTDYEQVETLDEADFVYCGVPFIFEEQYKKYPELRDKFLPFKTAESDKPVVWNSLTAEPFEEIVNEVIKSKLPAVNANPDYVAKEGHPLVPDLPSQFVIRNGTIAEMLRQAGAEVLEFGKPHKNIYEYAFEILQNNGIKINKARTCMIGDTVRTDIKGAINIGVAPILCVETGVTAEEISRGNSLENICHKENIALEEIIQIKSVGGK